jgi:cbb3-type cytochrome oxidase subunit 3
LFVLAVGYGLHLPYGSFWKSLGATAAERAAFLACDALQVIAVTQLFVLLLQWLAGRHWTRVAALLALVVIAVSPQLWWSGAARALPEPLGSYLDDATGSRFPVFPFSAFVLAGTLAGASLGRAAPPVRHRRALITGGVLLALGVIAAWALEGRIAYWWGASPAYVLVRLGALVLLLRAMEAWASLGWHDTRALALLGHETLLVYVLHLQLLFGGVLMASPLIGYGGRVGFGGAFGTVVLMLPVLLVAAWLWRAAKHRAPREAQLALVFLVVTLAYEFLTRPW